ncbi:MAG TPA: hypothetical protein VFV52_10060 [Bacilli bacterium]|nr:hypothetical protein [Bacilli bacterium]
MRSWSRSLLCLVGALVLIWVLQKVNHLAAEHAETTYEMGALLFTKQWLPALFGLVLGLPLLPLFRGGFNRPVFFLLFLPLLLIDLYATSFFYRGQGPLASLVIMLTEVPYIPILMGAALLFSFVQPKSR